jgi:hypothetical protein
MGGYPDVLSLITTGLDYSDLSDEMASFLYFLLRIENKISLTALLI